MEVSKSRQWCLDKGKEEWLRLIDFINPGAKVIKEVIAQAKAKAPNGEFPAYVPPNGWKGTIADLVKLQVEAIYETLRERGIGYAVERWDSQPPAQVIRPHEEILDSEGIGGPCIDLAVLMAACLEAVGIQPLIIILKTLDEKNREKRHAVLGYRLEERVPGPKTPASEIPHLLIEDEQKGKRIFGLLGEQELYRLKNTGDVEFINCTGITRGDNTDFKEAQRQGLSFIESSEPGKAQKYGEHWQVIFALDVKVARRTALTREMEDYLNGLREDLLTLPAALGFPSDLNFSKIRVQVKVRKGARRFSETEARAREIARRQGYADEESISKAYQYPWPSPEEEMKREAERPLDWDREVRRRVKRAIILGDPGFGKTWLLKHEALKLAEKALKTLSDYPFATDEIQLPIFLPLVQLAEEMDPQGKPLTLDQAIILGLENRYPIGERLRKWITEKFHSDRLVLLLDALDEVPSGQKERLCECLDVFARKYKGPQILLTSRLVGYPGAPFPLPKEGEFELLPFDRRQQRDFVRAWFSGRPERGEAFLRKLRESLQVQALARIPLLLDLMCRLFDESDELPKSRAELYEACLWGILTKKWKTPRSEDEPYLHAKLRLVEEIAYRLFIAEKELFYLDELLDLVEGVFQNQPRLEQNIGNKTPADLISELQTDGLLIKAGAGVNPPFLFLHLTFQEYLAACALARRTKPVQQDEQEVPEWLKLIKPRLFHPRWREVITMLSSRLDDASLLLRAIWDQPEDILLNRLFLACDCLGEARSVDDAIASEIRGKVMFILDKASAEVQLKGIYQVYEVEALLSGLFDRRFAWAIGRLMQKGIVTLDELLHHVTTVFEHLQQNNYLCTDETLTFIGVLLNAIASVNPDTAQNILSPVIKQWPVSLLAERLLTFVADYLPDAFLIDALHQGCVYAAEALQSRGEDVGDCLLAEMMQRFEYLRSHWNELLAYILTLGRIREQKALPLLVEFLQQDLPFGVRIATQIRESAAFALAEIGYAQAIPYLLETVEHFGERDELEAALYALRMIGLPSLEPIIGLLIPKESFIAAYGEILRCALAIMREGGCPDPLATELKFFMDDPQLQLRLLAATALAVCGDEGGRSKLIDLLKYPEAARDAALALAAIKAQGAVPALSKLLDASLSQRERETDLMTVIIKALDELDTLSRGGEVEPDLIRAVIWALGEIGGQEAVKQLAKVLQRNDVDVPLRLEAAIGLTKNGKVDLQTASTIASIAMQRGPFALRVYDNPVLWIAQRVPFRILLSGEVEPY